MTRPKTYVVTAVPTPAYTNRSTTSCPDTLQSTPARTHARTPHGGGRHAVRVAWHDGKLAMRKKLSGAEKLGRGGGSAAGKGLWLPQAGWRGGAGPAGRWSDGCLAPPRPGLAWLGLAALPPCPARSLKLPLLASKPTARRTQRPAPSPLCAPPVPKYPPLRPVWRACPPTPPPAIPGPSLRPPTPPPALCGGVRSPLGAGPSSLPGFPCLPANATQLKTLRHSERPMDTLERTKEVTSSQMRCAMARRRHGAQARRGRGAEASKAVAG